MNVSRWQKGSLAKLSCIALACSMAAFAAVLGSCATRPDVDDGIALPLLLSGDHEEWSGKVGVGSLDVISGSWALTIPKADHFIPSKRQLLLNSVIGSGGFVSVLIEPGPCSIGDRVFPFHAYVGVEPGGGATSFALNGCAVPDTSASASIRR